MSGILKTRFRQAKGWAQEACWKSSLQLRHRLHRGDFLVDYGGFRLLFTNDDDYQEVRYRMNTKRWFDYERETLKPWLKHSDTVIDVGANSGFLTILFTQLVGESGKVYSFEPAEKIFKKLLKATDGNLVNNVRPINFACGAEMGESVLKSVSNSSGHSTFVPTVKAGEEISAEKVRILCLDDFVMIEELRVDFLKIDTEGFEAEVLKGCSAILREHNPVVYIELTAGERLDLSRLAIDILREHGYSFTKEIDLASLDSEKNFIALPDHLA